MKKLEKIQEIIKGMSRISELKNYGFQFLSSSRLRDECSSEGIYIHRSKRIVVKRNYILNKPHVSFTVPTIEDRCPEGRRLLIQPLCNRLAKVDRDRIEGFQNRVYKKFPYADAHEGNIMKYRNRLVMVDW